MDHSASRDQDIGSDIDLESGICVIHGNEEGTVDEKLEKTVFLKLCDRIISVDDSSVKSDKSSLDVNEGLLVNNVKLLMENNSKRNKGSGAKKPPRPPRGLSLDGAGQKLIKELTELAVMKRARIERMKALTQKKASKISSSSSSSHGSYFAMFFTIIFFLVILLQGRNSGVSIQGASQMVQTDGSGLIAIQSQSNLSPEMSSDTHPIVISSDTETDETPSLPSIILESVSSPSLPTIIFSSVESTPQSSPVRSESDTEPFEEGEVAPTPPVSPVIRRGPAVVPIIQPGELLPYGHVYRLRPDGPRFKRTAARRFRRTMIRSPAALVSLPPSSPSPSLPSLSSLSPPLPPLTVSEIPSAPVHSRDPVPTSELPLKKRARFDSLPSATTGSTQAAPPSIFEVGESSRAATARLLTAATLDSRLDHLQGEVDRAVGHIEEVPVSRIEALEEEVEGLVQGRVAIDVSYQGLESRQLESSEQIARLRDEMPELFDRAQMSQEEHHRQASELTSVQARLTASESRGDDLQLRVEHLEEIVVAMSRDIQKIGRWLGGAPPGGA